MMRRDLALSVYGVLLLGCSAERGASLEITGVPAPSTSCVYSASGTEFLATGEYDPRGYGNYAPNGFTMALRLQNNSVLPATDPAVIEGGRNVRSDGNDIHVVGFDVCWDLASRHSDYGAARLDCGTLDATRRAFIAASTNVTAGGSEGIAVLDVLQPAHLRGPNIFGPSFAPTEIPVFAPALIGGKTVSFSYPVESSKSAGRSPNWGGFPTDADNNRVAIFVGLRATGNTVAGSDVVSNWVTFPITIAVGMLADSCQPYPQICGTNNDYIGGFVNVGGSCHPGAGGSTSCTTVTTCP
jgi:hypothetical protein